MAWKASKTKIAKPKIMTAFIVGSIGFQICILIVAFFLQNHFNMTSEPIICANLQDSILIQVPYVSIVALVEHIFIICFGIFCDIALYFFIKKRNIQLVPWTSSQSHQDPNVPLKATFLTSGKSCLVCTQISNEYNFSFT